MITFLTSSPTGSLDGKYQVDGLDTKNGFVDELRKNWKENSRVLMITAFPENIPASEQMTEFFEEQTRKMGFSVACFDLLDDRNSDINIASYDVIFLGGGHVPTQNHFFHRIHLKERMEQFKGIVIGISAGSMNCASIVYAQPEEPGEATDPSFERFIEGLGFTSIQVLPHYQMIKDHYLDGMRLFEDITYASSYGQYFYAIVDGSYILVEDTITTIHGECYLIHDGTIQKICDENEVKEIKDEKKLSNCEN